MTLVCPIHEDRLTRAVVEARINGACVLNSARSRGETSAKRFRSRNTNESNVLCFRHTKFHNYDFPCICVYLYISDWLFQNVSVEIGQNGPLFVAKTPIFKPPYVTSVCLLQN